jgi:hypothetical protein
MSDIDSFASLLAEDLSTSTRAFLSVYREGIYESPDQVAALTRFKVKTITINKYSSTYQHEYLTVSVLDDVTRNSYIFVIERNASAPTLQLKSSTNTATLSTPASLDSDSESYPLLRVNNTLLSPASPSSHSSSEELAPLTAPRPLLSRPPSTRSLLEKVSMASVRVAHSSLASLESAAEDRVLGSGTFMSIAHVRGVGRDIGEIVPIDLSLYELGILADVVHNEAPNYSICGNQCYWFVATICGVVRFLYSTGAPANYLANLGGRWRNLLIIAPEDLDEIKKVAVTFSHRQQAVFSKVGFYYI